MADEPTGNLDEENAWQIMTMLDELNRAGTTVMVASHNRDIVTRMGKRVIRLERGKAVE